MYCKFFFLAPDKVSDDVALMSKCVTPLAQSNCIIPVWGQGGTHCTGRRSTSHGKEGFGQMQVSPWASVCPALLETFGCFSPIYMLLTYLLAIWIYYVKLELMWFLTLPRATSVCLTCAEDAVRKELLKRQQIVLVSRVLFFKAAGYVSGKNMLNQTRIAS